MNVIFQPLCRTRKIADPTGGGNTSDIVHYCYTVRSIACLCQEYLRRPVFCWSSHQIFSSRRNPWQRWVGTVLECSSTRDIKILYRAHVYSLKFPLNDRRIHFPEYYITNALHCILPVAALLPALTDPMGMECPALPASSGPSPMGDRPSWAVCWRA